MSLSHVSMMAFRTAAACALLALPVFPVRADYIADTGRTQKQEVSSESIGELSAPADAAPVASVELHDLYDAAVEKALLESGIERLAVNSEGINTSIRTFADYQVNSITGQGRLKMADGKRIDPLYAVLGMIYQNKAWVHAPIIPVENAKLAARMGLNPKTHNRVSPVWVMKTPAARNLVMPLLSGGKSPDMGLSEDEKKALDRFAYRIGAFLSLPNEFKLVPVMGEVRDEWVAPSHLTNPSSVNDHELQHKVAALDTSRDPYAATISLDKAIRSAYDDKNTTQVAGAVAAFIKTVDGTPEYMTTSVRKLDYWNTVIQPFKKAALLSMFSFFAFVIYLMTVRRRDTRGQAGSGSGSGEEPRQPLSETEGSPVDKPSLVSALVGTPAMATAGGAGIMAFDGGAQAIPATGGGPVLRIPGAGGGADYGDPTLQAELEMNKGSRAAWGLAYLLLAASAGMMVAALVTRFIIGGRMPVSNMYESITFAMAAFAIVSLVFEGIHRRGWVGVGAAFAGWGLMTLANSMPLHMRKVEPLVAVLKSVWLNYHVTALLISYSAFLLAFVCGILYFIKDLTGNRPGGLPRKEVFEYLSYRAIQVGWPLLTLGIFLGAVWANTAWGSYWSWDPKETWALITWFAYTIYLHFRMILGWTNRKAVLANILGFLMVLITYFGVSYLPGLSGGMHSYAAPISK